MTTRSYVGIDASKDRLNVAVPGERQEKQVNHTQAGMGELVEWMQKWQSELIKVFLTACMRKFLIILNVIVRDQQSFLI